MRTPLFWKKLDLSPFLTQMPQYRAIAPMNKGLSVRLHHFTCILESVH